MECWNELQTSNIFYERTNSSSIYPLLSRTGGIRPPVRKRSRLALTLVEREEISRGLESRLSLRSIALRLGRSPSTVSREVKRNGGRDKYRAVWSDQAAWDRAHRPKACKLACNCSLRWTVSRKLQLNWSPEQIAGWLKRKCPQEEHNQVSHETIYRSLFVQARGVLKKELMQYLRSKRTIRRSVHASLKRDGLGQIKDAVSIRQRPASVEDRAVPGHWEGDLIGGSRNSYIATLVERHTRYVMLAKVPNKDTQSVVSALIKQAHKPHWQPILMCTFVIQVAHGNAAPTRTPIGCSGSTFQRELTCPCTLRPISTR